jgi:serine/threonine protein kinase
MSLAPDLPKDIHRKQIVGTLGYMAPEMVFREASYASDLYSTGVLFYQLMSGKLPLNLEPTTDAEGLRKMLKRVVQEDRTPLLRANPSLSDQAYLSATIELVDQMIAKDPTRRPPVEDCFNEWAALWNEVPNSALGTPIEYRS